MKKYSLIWWFLTGRKFKQQCAKDGVRYARKYTHHLAYKLGFLIAK